MEHRKHKRHEVNLGSQVAGGANDDALRTIMANLSLGGCFIRSDNPHPPGTEVKLKFDLPGSSGGSVTAVGRVCWVRDDARGPKGMGIQFTKLESSDLDYIAEYISGVRAS